MKNVYVNLTNRTVTVDGKICNTLESGLEPNGTLITDSDQIIDHMKDRFSEKINIVFDDIQKFIDGEIITDEKNNEWLVSDGNQFLLAACIKDKKYFDRDCEGDIIEMDVPDDVGTSTKLKCKSSGKNDHYSISDFEFNGAFWARR